MKIQKFYLLILYFIFFQETKEEVKTEETETIEKPVEDAKPTPEEVVETSEEKKEGTEEE